METTVMLVGRSQPVIDDVLEKVNTPDIRFRSGTSLDDVQTSLAETHIDHVILGGGLDLETRLEIVREIFLHSSDTTVHMNAPAGPQSFLPFVQAVLRGLDDFED